MSRRGFAQSPLIKPHIPRPVGDKGKAANSSRRYHGSLARRSPATRWRDASRREASVDGVATVASSRAPSPPVDAGRSESRANLLKRYSRHTLPPVSPRKTRDTIFLLALLSSNPVKPPRHPLNRVSRATNSVSFDRGRHSSVLDSFFRATMHLDVEYSRSKRPRDFGG